MIFFLFLFSFFPYIHSDCLEFNNSLINQCLIKENENYDLDFINYYHQCLQCTIQTLIKPENIKFEEDNQCLVIELQCIQLIFNTIENFEDFFQFHQQYLYELFFKDNGTDQNTLHIIIKENTLEEINADYIERIFQVKYQSYRALFIELHIKNQNIEINRNLINITRLSIKLIFVCEDKNKLKQTIYIIHNRKIFLENEQDFCSTIFIPSLKIISSTALSISHEKPKNNIILIIILLTAFLVSLLISLIIYCFKRIRLSKPIDTTSELSISQDETPLTLNETPLTPNETPTLSLNLKRPGRGMRAIQLLEDDV